MRNSLNMLLLSALAALSVLSGASAQTVIKTTRKADNTLQHYKETVPGNLNFIVPITGPLPTDAVPARVGTVNQYPYTPSAPGQVAIDQFGTGLYYAPNFKFLIDFVGWKTPAQRRDLGVNMFSRWAVRDGDRAGLQPGEGFVFLSENFLGDQAFGHKFCFETLASFFDQVWSKCPAIGYGDFAADRYVTLNLENPLYCDPGNKGGPALGGDWTNPGFYGQPGYPDWNQAQNQLINLETTGERITLGQLAARGRAAWYSEYHTRLATRINLIQEIIRKKSAPGTRISSGCMLFSAAFPNAGRQADSDLLVNGNGQVNYAGGDAQGNITFILPGGGTWPVNLAGPVNSHEDWVNDARGRPLTDFTTEAYQRIFISKTSGYTRTAQIWAEELPIHIVAEEKGLYQHERQRMRDRLGLTPSTYRGIMRERQFFYESNTWLLPFPGVQAIPGFDLPPRLYHPPYTQYGAYVVARFFGGDSPDWGYHLFCPGAPAWSNRDPATDPEAAYRAYFNHDLHPVEAMFQARRDMQFLERFYPGSTLIEDPDVQIGATGAFRNYNGIVAWDEHGVPLPAYMMRYKPVPGGTRVVILGGFKQAHTADHVDVVRAPNRAINGASFKVKLHGPGAWLFDFIVPDGESGQTYSALPVNVPAQQKPGYSGVVLNPN